jgi:hypothetical protein
MTVEHRFAVIPTHDRHEMLDNCMEAIGPQVERIFVIDNASNPPVRGRRQAAVIIRDSQQPPNLSRLWNIGLAAVSLYARVMQYEEWDVAILNDDALPYEGWMESVCAGIRSGTALAGCTMPGVPAPITYDHNAYPGVSNRVTGWAFVLRGESGIRFDEQFEWWCGDDDISEYARCNGGLVVVPGPEVPNLLANSTTVGANLAQSAIDMQRYVDKHGRRPW